MGDGATADRSVVITAVRGYIMENFLYMRKDFELREDTKLLDAGILDSMGVVELLEFLQDRFEIVIEDDEISEENLESLETLERLVARKRDGSRAA